MISDQVVLKNHKRYDNENLTQWIQGVYTYCVRRWALYLLWLLSYTVLKSKLPSKTLYIYICVSNPSPSTSIPYNWGLGSSPSFLTSQPSSHGLILSPRYANYLKRVRESVVIIFIDFYWFFYIFRISINPFSFYHDFKPSNTPSTPFNPLGVYLSSQPSNLHKGVDTFNIFIRDGSS